MTSLNHYRSLAVTLSKKISRGACRERGASFWRVLLCALSVLCSENLGAVGLFGQQEPRAPGAWGVYNSPNVGGRFYAAVLGVSVTSNPKPSRRLTR